MSEACRKRFISFGARHTFEAIHVPRGVIHQIVSGSRCRTVVQPGNRLGTYPDVTAPLLLESPFPASLFSTEFARAHEQAGFGPYSEAGLLRLATPVVGASEGLGPAVRSV
jgi:hypothetical protein